MIGKQQNGIDTATESLALQNSGNSMIEHKKGLLQETLSDVFEYAIELALLNWNTTMLFRITGKNGEDDFESFNPDLLNHVPVLIESDTEYRENYLKNNPDAKPEDYKYMQSDKGETRKILFDLNVTVGAGLPNNRAYRYSIVQILRLAQSLIGYGESYPYQARATGLLFGKYGCFPDDRRESGGLYRMDAGTFQLREPAVRANRETAGAAFQCPDQYRGG